MTKIKMPNSNWKVNSWSRSCLRKKKLSFDTAENVIKRANKSGNYLRSYICPFCLKYHVTKHKN